MDFFDNVVNKSNAIIKERLNSPFGTNNKQKEERVEQQEQDNGQKQTTNLTNDNQDKTTPCLESVARQQQQSMGSRDSNASNSGDPNCDKNSQFAAIAADAEAVAQKAAKGAKNIGTFLFSMANKAGQTVSQTAKQVKQVVENTNILTDFTREQQEFIKEHGGSLQSGDLPWDNCEDQSKAAYIKEQILSLSQDKRNFVRNPPNDSEFKFDPQAYYPQALSLLKEDPNLSKLRYELVPKLVSEDTFWCNYFYRVSMLKQMSEQGDKAKQGWMSSRSSSGEGPDEVGGSITPHGTIDEPVSPGYTTTTNNKQESFNLEQQAISRLAEESSSINAPAEQQQRYQQSQDGQYETQELESSSSRKLFAEADDLKSKLRELNIGSLDEEDEKWEEELQRDLQEFELVSGEDVDAYDEETLQNEIMQLKKENDKHKTS